MKRFKNGFTLVELLATLVILGIVVGITIIAVNVGLNSTKEKTEQIFIKSIEDALDVFLSDSNVKKDLVFSNSPECSVSKTHGLIKVYKDTGSWDFTDVINSTYKPIVKDDLINPANETSCSELATIDIYKDEDGIYYYKVSKSSLGCLTSSGYITNLPDGCD